MSLHFYNTLTRQLEEFKPLTAGQVKMYVCGMTVYDLSHLGHARSMVAFDIIYRWLRLSGYQVKYVRNITDIDDKIIRRAQQNNESIAQLTERMIQALHEDETALGILSPSIEPRATQYITPMLELIEKLTTKGLAYQPANGDVLYAVRKFADYGKLSNKSIDELQAGQRIAIALDKQDPLDFVLWKKAKPEEPTEAKWDSQFGCGRPGWHLECSAMSQALLGEQFDIHGGGADLQFPHHENEIAQSQGATGKIPARYWLHNGFIRINNEKMSKSLGNFFTIREVLANYDSETIRFFIARAHYRHGINYSDEHLQDAKNSLRRLYTSLSQVAQPQMQPIDWQNPYALRFKKAMDNDINTPEATAVLFELASEVNRSKSAQSAGLLKSLANCLGLLEQEPQSYLKSGIQLTEEYIQQQIDSRLIAKQNKDYALADKIRQDLLTQGIVLKDSTTGTTWESI